MRRGMMAALGMVCAGLMPHTAYGQGSITLTANPTVVARGGTVRLIAFVNPYASCKQVTFSVPFESDEFVDTTLFYVWDRVFNNAGDAVTITAKAEFNNGYPDVTDSITIDVVGIDITGSAFPLRGWNTAYTAESDPGGKPISQFNWTYDWGTGQNTYQDNDIDDDDKSSWSGKMVVNGTITCSATVSGINCSDSLDVSITTRNWATPIGCNQDNEPGYGDIPTPLASLGQNRDRDSDCAAYIFVPRDGDADFSPARTLSLIGSGPCTGWYYVSSSMLKCQRETVINRYIKHGGPNPPGTIYNFYDRNDSDCIDAAAFVQATQNHEYRGTPSTYKSIEGHQGRIEKSIVDDGFDSKQSIEALTHRDLYVLTSQINAIIIADEDDIEDFALDEAYMESYGPNWGLDAGALGFGMHKRWDSNSSVWASSCNNGPSDF